MNKKSICEHGHSGHCKTCYMRQYREKNREYFKTYSNEYNKEYYKHNAQKMKDSANNRYKEKKEVCLKDMKKYAEKHKEERKEYQAEYFKKNHDKLLKKNSKNYNKNKIKYNKAAYLKKKERLKTDINFYIKDRLSTRMRMAIMNHKGIKDTSAIELLGAPIDVVRKHLEAQFKEGMSWENHGIVGWHVDHKIPCDSFNLKDKNEQKECFHYTNLQPLWYEENLLKANTI